MTKDLSWEEMMEAKNTMLHFMVKSTVLPMAHAESLAAFFVALKLHPRQKQTNGKRALLLYQSCIRCKWFDTLKHDKGFNIERIGENLLWTLAEEVNESIREANNRARDREFDQVQFSCDPEPQARADLSLSLPPPPRFHPTSNYLLFTAMPFATLLLCYCFSPCHLLPATDPLLPHLPTACHAPLAIGLPLL